MDSKNKFSALIVEDYTDIRHDIKLYLPDREEKALALAITVSREMAPIYTMGNKPLSRKPGIAGSLMLPSFFWRKLHKLVGEAASFSIRVLNKTTGKEELSLKDCEVLCIGKDDGNTVQATFVAGSGDGNPVEKYMNELRTLL